MRAIADSYEELRESIKMTLNAHALVGAPAMWVLPNHDVMRPVIRYRREDTSFAFDVKRFGTPTNRRLGTRRARAAALLTAALPGCRPAGNSPTADCPRTPPSGSGSDG